MKNQFFPSVSRDQFQIEVEFSSSTAIARQLEAYLEGATGGSILEATENLPVRVRVGNAQRADLSQIASLNLNANGSDRNAMENVVIKTTRHVVTTTVTTIAGFIPLLISGGPFWPPLAIAITGGISGSSILALYFVPAVYLIIKRRGRKMKIDSSLPQDEKTIHSSSAS